MKIKKQTNLKHESKEILPPLSTAYNQSTPLLLTDEMDNLKGKTKIINTPNIRGYNAMMRYKCYNDICKLI